MQWLSHIIIYTCYITLIIEIYNNVIIPPPHKQKQKQYYRDYYDVVIKELNTNFKISCEIQSFSDKFKSNLGYTIFLVYINK